MKRSEMLKIMDDVIQENSGKRVNDGEVLDELLKAIEQAGMLPPLRTTPNNRIFSGPTISVENNVVACFEWEDENDSNS